MRTVHVVPVLLAIIFVVSVAAARPAGDGVQKADAVRLLAHTDNEVAKALEQGCKVVRHARQLRAVACPKAAVAALGLPEDIRVFAVDTGANTQVKADLVHSAGNTGSGRVIAVLDTGVDYNHAQLSDSIIKGRDFVDDDDDPLDLNGHGTHVAGLITANSGKARGVAPDAQVLAVRVLDKDGGGFFSDIIAAIYWAADSGYGVDAISMSLGTSRPYTYKGFCDNVFPDMTNAVKYARDKNVLVVVAAGNAGNAGISIPGCISHSFTVGAVDKSDRVASFSGRGSALDVTAPGVSLYSTWLNNGFATASGTSMSTPIVAGIAGLVKSAHNAYTDEQVEQALVKTAKDLGKSGFDTSFGWGRIDAQKAVAY
ncbi:MAG: S8 family serine peptidase [Candidatus Aenigmarchaeota archaeon]|nr:S8 family serine peptidase [Candidatus Aenigmarchaeota archaeon]